MPGVTPIGSMSRDEGIAPNYGFFKFTPDKIVVPRPLEGRHDLSTWTESIEPQLEIAQLKRFIDGTTPIPPARALAHLHGLADVPPTLPHCMHTCRYPAKCTRTPLHTDAVDGRVHVDASPHGRAAFMQLERERLSPQAMTVPLETRQPKPPFPHPSDLSHSSPPLSTPPYPSAPGTWTPLHTDVLRSYSWSVNVCGRKRWLFLDPAQAKYVRHKHTRATVYDVHSPVDPNLFPDFDQARWAMVEQGAGDAIFVPSNWLHQVTNLVSLPSILLLSALSLTSLSSLPLFIPSRPSTPTPPPLTPALWRLLKEDEEEARAAICDVEEMVKRGQMTEREFQQLVQRNLMANSGA
ncbi:unnamed protein product [Closterium sp. Naga37s-1]|nr:unnamed protein product [Closterium sp. Naga37s-1]